MKLCCYYLYNSSGCKGKLKIPNCKAIREKYNEFNLRIGFDLFLHPFLTILLHNKTLVVLAYFLSGCIVKLTVENTKNCANNGNAMPLTPKDRIFTSPARMPEAWLMEFFI